MSEQASEFEAIAGEIGRLVAKKNEAYGDAFVRSGQVLALLYPDGVLPAQYGDMLAVVRIVDKLFRIANDAGAFGESPYADIAGYGVLGVARGRGSGAAG